MLVTAPLVMQRSRAAGVAVLLVAIAVALQQIYSRYWWYLPGIVGGLRLNIQPNRPSFWETPSSPHQQDLSSNAGFNIVFIVADDLGFNDVSIYGGGIDGVPTPNIDSIGLEGAVFSAGYAGHATCAPSRAAIMTGRYGTRFGFEFTPVPKVMSKTLGENEPGMIRPNMYFKDRETGLPSIDEMTVPLSQETIAERLRQQGYHNMLVGKWHLGHSSGHSPVERGFDEMIGFNLGASLYLPVDHPQVVNDRLLDFPDRFLWANLKYFVTQSNATHNVNFEPNEYMTGNVLRLILNQRLTFLFFVYRLSGISSSSCYKKKLQQSLFFVFGLQCTTYSFAGLEV